MAFVLDISRRMFSSCCSCCENTAYRTIEHRIREDREDRRRSAHTALDAEQIEMTLAMEQLSGHERVSIVEEIAHRPHGRAAVAASAHVNMTPHATATATAASAGAITGVDDAITQQMPCGFEVDPDLHATQLLAQQLEAEESELAAREAQEREDERDRQRQLEEQRLVAEVRAFEAREAAREDALPGLSAQKVAMLPRSEWTESRNGDGATHGGGDASAAAADVDNLCVFCQYCFTPGDQVMTLPCFHTFHQECLEPWLQVHKKCPTCQSDIDIDRYAT